MLRSRKDINAINFHKCENTSICEKVGKCEKNINVIQYVKIDAICERITLNVKK